MSDAADAFDPPPTCECGTVLLENTLRHPSPEHAVYAMRRAPTDAEWARLARLCLPGETPHDLAQGDDFLIALQGSGDCEFCGEAVCGRGDCALVACAGCATAACLGCLDEETRLCGTCFANAEDAEDAAENAMAAPREGALSATTTTTTTPTTTATTFSSGDASHQDAMVMS